MGRRLDVERRNLRYELSRGREFMHEVHVLNIQSSSPSHTLPPSEISSSTPSLETVQACVRRALVSLRRFQEKLCFLLSFEKKN